MDFLIELIGGLIEFLIEWPGKEKSEREQHGARLKKALTESLPEKRAHEPIWQAINETVSLKDDHFTYRTFPWRTHKVFYRSIRVCQQEESKLLIHTDENIHKIPTGKLGTDELYAALRAHLKKEANTWSL